MTVIKTGQVCRKGAEVKLPFRRALLGKLQHHHLKWVSKPHASPSSSFIRRGTRHGQCDGDPEGKDRPFNFRLLGKHKQSCHVTGCKRRGRPFSVISSS